MTTTNEPVVQRTPPPRWPNWPTVSEANDGVAKRVTVNKQTHRVRYENETESQVTVVIEPKESNETE